MKKLGFDKKRECAKIMVELLDDIWYLKNIVEKGDFVSGKTERKINIGSGKDAKTSVVKKTIWIKICVEEIEYHKTTNRLRISGKIEESSDEDVTKGKYHTINIEEGTVIEVEKPLGWKNYQKEQLEQAVAQKSKAVFICLFERDRCMFARMKRDGYEMISEIEGEVEKKGFENQSKGDFFEEIIKNIEEYDKRFNPEKIIIASPAFWNDELVKRIKTKDIQKKIFRASVSSIDESGLNELMKSSEIQKAVSEEIASEEINLVERLLLEIRKEGKGEYGFNQVKKAAEMGAVEIMMVTDGFISKKREENNEKDVEELMDIVDKTGGKVKIISSEHDSGKKLDGLGGIGALLRYKIE